jgi:hypothetical protein
VYFFHSRSCFGEEVVVRVSRSGDDVQICCSFRRNYHPIERMQKPLRQQIGPACRVHWPPPRFWTLDRDEEFRVMLDGVD